MHSKFSLYFICVCVEKGKGEGGRWLSKTHEKCPFFPSAPMPLFSPGRSVSHSLTHALPPFFYFYLTLSWRFVTISGPWSEKRAPAANTSWRFITQSLRVQVSFFFVVVPLSSYLFFSFIFMNLFSGAVRGGGYLLPRLFFYWRCGFKEEKHPIKLLIQLLSRGYAARERERPCKAGKQGRGLSSSSNGLSRVVYSNSGI